MARTVRRAPSATPSSMKITTLLRQLSLLSLVTVAGRAQVTIDFNTYVSPTNNAFVNNFSRSSTAINQATTGGVTGGAVTGFAASSDGNGAADFVTYTSGVVFAGPVSTSVMFKYDSSNRDPFNTQHSYVGFGLANNVVPSISNGQAYVGFKIESYATFSNGSGIWARGTAPSLAGGDEAFNPVEGHWYQFTTGITKVGGAFNQLNLTLRLDDYGTSGTSLVSTVFNTTRAFSSATWMGDTELYAMFGTSVSSGFVATDNFSVSAIPEPSTYAAMAGAVALVSGLLWRRRKGAVKMITEV